MYSQNLHTDRSLNEKQKAQEKKKDDHASPESLKIYSQFSSSSSSSFSASSTPKSTVTSLPNTTYPNSSDDSSHDHEDDPILNESPYLSDGSEVKRSFIHPFLFTEPHLLHAFLSLLTCRSGIDGNGHAATRPSPLLSDEKNTAESSWISSSSGFGSYQALTESSSPLHRMSQSMTLVSEQDSVNSVHPRNKTMEEEEEPSARLSRRIWLKSSSFPISHEPRLRQVIYTVHFWEGIQTMIGQVWPAIFSISLLHDLIQFGRLPSDHYGNTLNSIFWGYPTTRYNQNIWSGFFDAQDAISGYGHWLAVELLTGLPLLWGAVRSLRHMSYMGQMTQKKSQDNLKIHFSEVSGCSDIRNGQCIWPGLGLSHHWHIAAMRLLWNGRLSPQDQKNLFQLVRGFADGPNRIAQWYALSTLADLVDYARPEDWDKLYPRSHSPEERMASEIRQESILALKNLSEYKPSGLSGFLPFLYANYLLWKLGLMKGNPKRSRFILEPTFWAIQIYGVYTQYRFWERLLINLGLGIRDKMDQQDCESKGKQWGVRPEVGESECSVCGDWPIYIGDIQSSENVGKAF